jgi:hypothetical protein
VTFIAVVIAWVPFRAVSMDTTFALWKGMLGINGLSLPERFAATPHPLLGRLIQFHGVLPGLGLDFIEVGGWIAVGLLTVWAFPNTQQWLAPFAPAWEPVKTSRWHWALNGRNGILAGALLGISLVSTTRNSEFLYFQF